MKRVGVIPPHLFNVSKVYYGRSCLHINFPGEQIASGSKLLSLSFVLSENLVLLVSFYWLVLSVNIFYCT